MTALDLAMNAKLPGSKVQEYLDKRASEFAADFEVTEQGGILYYFQVAPTVNQSETPAVKIAVKEPEITREKTPEKSPEFQSQSVKSFRDRPAFDF